MRTIFIATDVGTGYSEGVITANRDLISIFTFLEHVWILHHGSPASLSADDEYNMEEIRTFLLIHNVVFKPRPARRHNKTGIVERKIQTIKDIVRKINREISNYTHYDVLARSIFMSNFFSGSRLFSSFQLVRGYQPSILRMPANRVPQDLMDAHINQTAVRSIQREIRSPTSNYERGMNYKRGDRIWVLVRRQDTNEAKGSWV